MLQVAGPQRAFGQSGGELVPWIDPPPPNPAPPEIVGKLLDWQRLDSWTTSANDFFNISHYGLPGGLNEANWKVELTGLVARPRTLTMADIKAHPLQEVDFTLECSGNTGIPFFIGGIGNARWGGARLAPLLEQANILDGATEVIFWGVDRGGVTVRDNSGILSAGQSGSAQPDGAGGLDLTFTEQFARSMSVEEALSRDNILCYQMNGGPLPADNGFPVRLIAPGWYGVANVKWLTRIEVTDRRYTGRFMARDYVTARETRRDGQAIWTFTTVGLARLKSAPAKVTRSGDRFTIMGAAWGAPIRAVEVQIDGGPWMPAVLDNSTPPQARRFSWRFWTLDWAAPGSGEHTIRSRAIDVDGNVQPAPDDEFLSSKRTYWESNGQITRRVRIA
ncbi:MAG: molybdopterin-dependent oxidoreductase [Bryobacteraceae bacterium]|nr:molybdopterin-dependent oxidoreductase [Bryobacteraceae bacterium]